MKAQDYITSKLEKLRQPESLRVVEPDDFEAEILARVLSKKFRKYKVSDDAIELCKKAIHYAVENRKPVKVGLLFGGNKLWRFDEAPEVDWAELFNVIYVASWMKTIASVYQFGAEFEYYSQDISVERLNNLSRAETSQYTKTFRGLLEWIQPYLPDRVKIRYKCHSERFRNDDEYNKEIKEAKAEMLAESGGKLPQLSEKQKLATENNVRLKPGQADDPEWRERVELEHQAIFITKMLLPYLEDETIIPTTSGRYDGCIATGSTKYSVAAFWAGVGALRPDGDSFKGIVLTPKQLEESRFEWQTVNLGIDGKNFSRIRVIKG
jgi:hypothetical protein